SWQLFEAIYATEEDTSSIPGVPAKEQDDNTAPSGIPAEVQNGPTIEQSNGKKTSPNQLQRQVERGQAPREVKRVDNSDEKYAKPHVHFKDGTAIDIDGNVHDKHHGTPKLSREVLNWLHDNGWCENLK
ncbi:MAG: hypothetical protein ACI4GW_03955, partial [Lachnospiraceae bacterium]